MKHPAENNFNIFVSLLLEGVGAGLIIVPSHLGITSEILSIVPLGILGFSCFITALIIQITSVWHVPNARGMVIQGGAALLLFIISSLFLKNGQLVSAFSMLITGLVQLYVLLPINQRFKQIDFVHLTIASITFATGIILAVSANNLGYLPLLAAFFLVAAFMGTISVVVPSFKYGAILNKIQVIPWVAIIFFYILPTGKANLVTPAAIIGTLLFVRLIPWDSLTMSLEDVLSRRMIVIAFVVEISHLLFLGTLLFVMDPGFKDNYTTVLVTRGLTLAFFTLFSTMIYIGVTTVIMTTSGLLRELSRGDDGEDEEASEILEAEPNQWTSRLEKYIKPYIMTPEGIRGRIQADKINTLSRQSATDKKRNAQLTLLLELSQQLENQLDPPVSAQLAVNTLERALNCGLAILFMHEPEQKEFMLLAAAGRQTHLIPTGYRQNASEGVIGRALRQRKTQIVNDIRMDPDYITFKDEVSLSAAVIPLIYNGHVHGVITLNNEKVNAFGSLEIGLAETVAAELTRAWERSGYHQRLTELIQTGSQLSSVPDPETAAKEVASISREIVQAKFTYIYIQLGQERSFIQHAASGQAPQLFASLRETLVSAELIKMALHATQPFRIRDVRRYEKTAKLVLDNNNLRSLLVIPIRWHHVNIGAIFAFGKQNEVIFTENDESLAELISIQAGGAFESTWLQQELRASLRITSLLYRLSNQIIQSENIEDAASDIAQTAHKLAKNLTTGIVLLNSEGDVIAEVLVNDEGKQANTDHPMSLIHDAMKSGQMIYFSPGESVLRTCLPIQTPIRGYGAIWMDTLDDPSKPSTNPNDLQALVNQAAIALERSLLLVESRRQAKEIKAAYDTLEATYDQTLASLTSALDARDRETEGHSLRVTHLAVKLGESLGYSSEQLKILERGSILHDIGKIGISDTILHKPGPLTEDEWKIMRLHPDIGARIVAGIPFLEETIPLIRHHQERWDGTGYPGNLKGTDIPELARLFSVIDAFDALTSNRPYRQKISKEEALEYLREMSGIHFDPSMVDNFETLLKENPELMLLGE
ncbi:MAG: GAF domain-containing protein [Chloroflexi bacterium]|nr:GAF domain-containing protein [Chloroflexota bacterium]